MSGKPRRPRGLEKAFPEIGTLERKQDFHFPEADLNEAARRRTLTREAISPIYG